MDAASLPAVQAFPEVPAAMVHPFFTYTGEILSWRLGQAASSASPPADPPRPDPERTAVRARRILRAATGRPAVLLLGLGAGELAAALAAALPRETALAVLSLDPPAAIRLREAGRLGWTRPDSPHQLLADTSPQALFCLPALAGLPLEQALVTVNPEDAPGAEREGLARLRRLLTDARPLALPEAPAAPDLTLAALVRPDEPDLAGFFAAWAGLASRAVLLWDGLQVPETAALAAALDMPVRHLARPLDRDFAAQRNALLAACPPGRVLALDPDERPGPGFGDTVARLAAAPEIGGVLFPRLTLYPDAGRAKVGYGLWPDLQLRLFSTAPPARPRYVRPVHERLEGLAGLTALALGATLLHHNRLLADDTAVKAKLAAYDAARGAPVHRLNRDYPTLALSFFQGLAANPLTPRVMLLPSLW